MKFATAKRSLFLICLSALVTCSSNAEEIADPASELRLIRDARQLTFVGKRAGEGYFSRDGKRMVFQSERDPANPFYQIYLLDLETGDVERVSPGSGKTTCAWIHPTGDQVLFASTHEDSNAVKKQKEELAFRESGKERRYAWDYDKNYDLFVYDRQDKNYTKLTNTIGYDAEGSWSPDGSKIVFASNRSAFEGTLSDEQQKLFERDKSIFAEIYICDADGSNVKRLTDTFGYDGGPFFSPDGNRICWRRFSEDGVRAEIMTMRIDGSDQKQLTEMGAMSWAPYYHPSGEYLVFTTNKHGFDNFELYLVDAAAKHKPVRVTHTDGFDGLPTFTPDGKQISWTSNRTSTKQSQIFVAGWNHEEARKMLELVAESEPGDTANGASQTMAVDSLASTSDEFSPDDILKHVDYLCRKELAGRLTGSVGEKRATAYVAAFLDGLGFVPAGDDGSWFQEFEFTSGVALEDDNRLQWGEQSLEVDTDWRPLAFSKTGEIDAAEIVFAGYGIVAPEDADATEGEEYDSFVHLDVKDKWVLVFRYMPDDISAERRQHLSRHSHPRFKAMVARDRGARGLIIVSGPRAKVKDQLIPLRFDGSLAGTSIPVISVTDEMAQRWLSSANKKLESLQAKLDTGAAVMGFAIPGHQLKASIDIERVKRTGRNVVGRLEAKEGSIADQAVIVGAHIDHLGRGGAGSSLAKEDEAHQIHFGADDNASGVAAILEMAQYLSACRRSGSFVPSRDLIFAAWSGEELGLLGSSHYAKRRAEAASQNSDSAQAGAEHSMDASTRQGSLYPEIAACLNLDMVGRLEKKLVLQGIGSSSIWSSVIEKGNVPVGLSVTLQQDSYVPTDASTFFSRGVPSLTAFTGSHSEYHTPRDTPDKLNYEGAAKIARLMALIARDLAASEKQPDFIDQVALGKDRPRARLRAYLGTVPDYAESDTPGVMLSGVSKGGPASNAGVKGGDVIVALAGKKIENIYDYTYAIEALKIGTPVKIVVLRDKVRVTLDVTPGSRD